MFPDCCRRIAVPSAPFSANSLPSQFQPTLRQSKAARVENYIRLPMAFEQQGTGDGEVCHAAAAGVWGIPLVSGQQSYDWRAVDRNRKAGQPATC